MFPGQGSQKVGMLRDAETEVEETFALASQVLGYDLWSLVQAGPEDRLDRTEFTQPALLTASYALYRLARRKGAPEPVMVAGHSLGEYSALVVAGVLSFSDAVSLVRQRGHFMQSAVPLGEGGMAAVIGLGDDQVKAICRAVSEKAAGDAGVQAVNFNAPGQVVIAGANPALEAAIEACRDAGARRAVTLAVSAPFHSLMMMPAAQRMRDALAKVRFDAPAIPVLQNLDAAIHRDPDVIRENLVAQMYSAVLWTDTVKKMVAAGVDTLVECGPGRVLTGLARRIDRTLTLHNVDSLASSLALAGAPDG